jgi:hypothetical protein
MVGFEHCGIARRDVVHRAPPSARTYKCFERWIPRPSGLWVVSGLLVIGMKIRTTLQLDTSKTRKFKEDGYSGRTNSSKPLQSWQLDASSQTRSQWCPGHSHTGSWSLHATTTHWSVHCEVRDGIAWQSAQAGAPGFSQVVSDIVRARMWQ